MLEEGLTDKLKLICDKIPQGSQCIMVSATMSPNVMTVSRNLMHEPIKILLKNSEVAVDLISQFYINVETEDLKFDTLIDLYSLMSTSQAIIFSNTIKKVDWLKENLEKNNFEITYIHGKMTAKERDDIVKEFREGKTRLLLTTDLLSRGIDIPQVNMVVNYDLPPNKETYIHRIGRCGRFDKKGVSITMIKSTDPYDIKTLNRMKYYFKMDIKEMPDNISTFL
jgi:superfamily II DNA/RNA helicase